MTWDIRKSQIVGGQPIVLWDETPLRQLDDTAFAKAASAAEALGDCVVLEATELKPGLAIDAARADLIVKAVIAEMERRGVEEVGEADEQTA